jgi:hypothetical protein
MMATSRAMRGAFINHPSRGRDREFEPRVSTALPEPAEYLEPATAAMWLEIKSRGYWLTSADRFLVEIAAALMARYRFDELKSGDVSLLVGLLGKIGFSANERGRMNLPTNITQGQAPPLAIFQYVILTLLRHAIGRSVPFDCATIGRGRRGWDKPTTPIA